MFSYQKISLLKYDRQTDQLNYALDAYWYKDFQQKFHSILNRSREDEILP